MNLKNKLNILDKKNINILYFFMIMFFVLTKYVTIIFNDILDITTFLTKVPYILFLICMFLKIYLLKIEKSEYIYLIISFLLYILTKDKSILIYTLIALASKDINFKDIVKYYFYINLIAFSLIVILVLINILPDVGPISYRAGTDKLREDFGFLNPNTPFFNLTPIIAGYLYIRYKNYNIIDRLTLISLILIVYIQTNSRTGLLCILSTLIFMEIIRIIDFKKNKILKIITIFIPLIFTVISVLIGTCLSQNYLLNKILSYRPVYWSEFLNKICIFGNINQDKLNKFPLDNSYIYMISISGLISALIMIIILCYSIKIAIDLDNKGFIVALFLFLVYAISENIFYDRPLNFGIVLSIIYFMKHFRFKYIKKV